MYIEFKGDDLAGPGRIGWVELSKSKRSYHYKELTLKKVGDGYKHNCVEEATGDCYWISGPKKNGADRLYGGTVEIDDDAAADYWTKVRNMPDSVRLRKYRC